jgi:hypothetical protein
MHILGAVGAETVSIFGPRSPGKAGLYLHKLCGLLRRSVKLEPLSRRASLSAIISKSMLQGNSFWWVSKGRSKYGEEGKTLCGPVIRRKGSESSLDLYMFVDYFPSAGRAREAVAVRNGAPPLCARRKCI